MNFLRLGAIVSLILCLQTSCGEKGAIDATPKFEDMLTRWADDIIIPGYQEYVQRLNTLNESIESLATEPTLDNLMETRTQWLSAYTSWQSVSMFDIGLAEQIGLRNFTNIYPSDTARIYESAQAGDVNLELPSNMAIQGFPAMESILYLSENPAETVNILQTQESYRDYLLALGQRLNDIGTAASDDWLNGYREVFIAASGSTATSSVNKMANDFLFYYEKAFRANKIGIPAGIFSNSPLADRVEGRYANGTSKALFLAALDATQHFFNGQPFAHDGAGLGFASYLEELDKSDIALDINAQFDKARELALMMDDDFEQQVQNDNSQMLA